jgi:HEAT repeat protein
MPSSDSLSSRISSLPPNFAAEVWLLIRKCFKLSEIVGDVKSKFLEQAISNLHNEDAWILSKFKIMSIAFVGENIEVDASRVAILEMLDDHDQRIRLAALNALYLIFKRGGDLALQQYSKAINMLGDISHQVRLAAYRLLFAFAVQTPETMIPARNIKNNEEIRLIDDAFAHLCDSMNDPESSVRAEGATLLGKFDGVSMRFLHQTLEKNLMTNLNRIRSLNERAKGEGGEFSSGRKFGDDKAVRGEVEDDNNVIARGACGAFIHGLEDEFQTVRVAALDALCTLAAKETTGDFAKQSMDYMVDMLNDEIEGVRLNAINNCVRLASRVPVLLEDQNENVLTSCLPDSRREIRYCRKRETKLRATYKIKILSADALVHLPVIKVCVGKYSI